MFRISSPAFLCFGFPFYRFLFVPLLRAIAIEHMIFSQTSSDPAFTVKTTPKRGGLTSGLKGRRTSQRLNDAGLNFVQALVV